MRGWCVAMHLHAGLHKRLLLVPPAGQTWRLYYYAGGTRVAMREVTSAGSTVSYLFGDHLGSTSITANSSGAYQTELRYKAWGENRFTSGTPPTKRQFTGQIDDSTINLYWYGSRWYDDALGRFIQPDPIIPEPYNSLAYDRYQYVYSNPVRYNDPSGHCIWDLCILEGIGLVELALVVGGSAVALYAATPDAREANIQAITEGLDWTTTQINNGLDGLRALAKSAAPKPLTSDEQEKVDHLNEDLDDFLDEHPDLAEEAARKANGEELEYDHPGEAEQYMSGVEADIAHLQSVRRSRNAEAQAAIDEAIQQAQAWLKHMRKILSGKK